MMLKTVKTFFIVLLPFLTLSGCFWDRYNAHEPFQELTGNNAAIAVQKGDSLHRVAQRYDVTLQDLINVNNLKPPYKIYPGQGLRLPKKHSHIVRRFETLENIAVKRNVTMEDLINENSLQSPYTIHEDQKLTLPSPQNIVRKRENHLATPLKKALEKPRQGNHIFPRIKKEEKIEPLLPLQKTLAPTYEMPFFESIKGFPPQKPHTLIQKESPPKTAPHKRVKKEIPHKAISKFNWPLRGRILAKYGKKTGGLRNDGINIAAAKGTVIKAAEHGHVVYVGSALKGYGKLVLLRHRGGWITAYAHCERTFVKKGDQVKMGKKIATVGASGNVKTPQLHFEVRKKTRTVDPLSYLR